MHTDIPKPTLLSNLSTKTATRAIWPDPQLPWLAPLLKTGAIGHCVRSSHHFQLCQRLRSSNAGSPREKCQRQFPESCNSNVPPKKTTFRNLEALAVTLPHIFKQVTFCLMFGLQFGHLLGLDEFQLLSYFHLDRKGRGKATHWELRFLKKCPTLKQN